MEKIAILYICTGNYYVFWEDFYKSSEKYFLEDCEKHYFVFTDKENLIYEDNKFVHKIYQESLGWPNNTLMRFHIFKGIEKDLINYDYVFFLNSNMKFIKEVKKDILPVEEGLLGVKHPGFYNKSNLEYSYDRNSNSMAYIEEGSGKYYFMGGFNGGRSEDFIKLIDNLVKNIDMDKDKNIVALWHDESHINRYFLDKNVKVIGPEYGYPEGWDLPFEPKIIIRDKNKWGGHKKLRNNKKINIFIRCIRLIKRGIHEKK